MSDHATAPMEMNFRRTFAAPLALVFKAWTEPQQLAAWWGPTGYTNPVCKIDVRPGGKIHIDMQSPDGVIHPMGGEFEEVDPPTRLTFTSAALDADGQPIFVNRNSIHFAEVEGGTEITIHVKVIHATPIAQQFLQHMEKGWNLSLDRLDEFVVSSVLR